MSTKDVPDVKNSTGIRRRASWSILDQSTSSLTNFVLSYVVLRSFDLEEFGAFTIAYTAYTLAPSLNRALVNEPLVIRYSNVVDSRWRRGSASAAGAAIVVGVVAGAIVAVAGLLTGGRVGSALITLAVVMPGLLFQDTWRYVFFSGSVPEKAFANDLLWGLMELGIVGALLLTGSPSIPTLILVWGLTGSLAGLIGMAQARVVPRPLSVRDWALEHRDIGPRFAAELILARSGQQFALVLVGAIAGLEAVGALNGARTLFGPLNVLFLGVVPFGVAEGVRLRSRQPRRLTTAAWSLGGLLGGTSVLIGIVLLSVSDNVARAVVPGKWDDVRPLVIPVGLFLAARGFTVAAEIGLRVLAEARKSLAAQLRATAVLLTAVPIGAAAGAGRGAAYALAVASLFKAVSYWRAFLRAHRDDITRSGGGEAPAVPGSTAASKQGLEQ